VGNYYNYYHHYCIELYGNICLVNSNKLVKLHNILFRILHYLSIRTHVTELYSNYCTLPAPVLHELQLNSVVHKYYYHLKIVIDIFRYNYFTGNNMIHQYNTRQHSDLHIPAVNLSKGQKSFKCKGCYYLSFILLFVSSISCHLLVK